MGNSVLWPINNRTRAKHHIIRNYLQAWLPIMTKWNKRIVYFDGFCGPGEYAGGEKGSPVIALETALNHSRPDVQRAEITWLFVDEDEKRINHLKSIINDMDIPDSYNIIYRTASFSETVEGIINILEEQNKQLAPSLIFIDPFGFSGFTIEQISKLMENDKCEVIINFMYEHINRFLDHGELTDTYDSLFGTSEWRKIADIKDPILRNESLQELYHKQLETVAKIKYVRSFELRRGNRPSYYLFFGTNSITGLEKMKEAMWRVDKSGNYSISDKYYGRRTLFEPEPDYNQLKEILMENLAGQKWDIDQLLKWILIHTAFSKNGVKSNVLKHMEKEGLIEVVESPRKRKGSYPSGTIIWFK